MRTSISTFLLLLALGGVAAAAEDKRPLPPMLCTCDANSEIGPCPNFQIRFTDENSAQVSHTGRPGSWSVTLSMTATKETLSVAGDTLGYPRIGCLTIDRTTGRFRSEIIEYGFQEFNGWINTGLCKAIPAESNDPEKPIHPNVLRKLDLPARGR
jgi:hypothetical protein